jgi:hypothetical protein
MKQRTEVNRKLALVTTIVMFICMLIISFQGQAQVKPKRMETSKAYHDRLQKANSWETYQSNRIKAAKAVRKAKNEQSALAKREERIRQRIRRIEG